jgi:hypothetical protein
MQDRRRDVGRKHIPVQPSAVRGQVPAEPMPGDSDRQRLVVGRRRFLDCDQEVVAAQIPDQGRDLSQGQASNFEGCGVGGAGRGWGVSLNFYVGRGRLAAMESGEKVQDASPPTRTPTPEAFKVEASRPGTMSAGAESARSATAFQKLGVQPAADSGSFEPERESKTRFPCVMSRYVCSAGTLPSPALNSPGEMPRTLASSPTPVPRGSRARVTLADGGRARAFEP